MSVTLFTLRTHLHRSLEYTLANLNPENQWTMPDDLNDPIKDSRNRTVLHPEEATSAKTYCRQEEVSRRHCATCLYRLHADGVQMEQPCGRSHESLQSSATNSHNNTSVFWKSGMKLLIFGVPRHAPKSRLDHIYRQKYSEAGRRSPLIKHCRNGPLAWQ